MLSNKDLTVLVSRRSAPMPFFVRDADGDVVYFVHRGEGTLETDYGPLRFRPGDYLVVPKGTTHRVVPTTTDNFFLISGDEFVLPDRGCSATTPCSTRGAGDARARPPRRRGASGCGAGAR